MALGPLCSRWFHSEVATRFKRFDVFVSTGFTAQFCTLLLSCFGFFVFEISLSWEISKGPAGSDSAQWLAVRIRDPSPRPNNTTQMLTGWEGLSESQPSLQSDGWSQELVSKLRSDGLQPKALSFYRIRLELCSEYYTVQVCGRIKVELNGSINLKNPCVKDT